MKTGKPIVFFLLFLAVIPLAFGMQVQSSYPAQMDFMQEADAKLVIFTQGQTVFDAVVILPHSWEITDWTATTPNVFAETRDTSYLEVMRSVYRWRVECQDEKVEISMKIKPTTSGNSRITTLWIYAGGFNSEDANVFVREGSEIITPQNFMLLAILLAATAIVIGGVAYREYKKIKSGGYKQKTRKKKR